MGSLQEEYNAEDMVRLPPNYQNWLELLTVGADPGKKMIGVMEAVTGRNGKEQYR